MEISGNAGIDKGSIGENKGEIVVYQPDEITRLEVRVNDDTVWLTQTQMSDLFGRDRTVITKHIRNIFLEQELDEKSNVHFLHFANSDKPVKLFSLDVIISVGYRVKSTQGIFFDGQIYDAYAFVADLVRKAARRIVLIDNYIDDTVLTILSKRVDGVEATIYTGKVSKQLQLDIDKHNAQYPPIAIRTFSKTHDRFLIIDDAVYLVGASIKDLGKKWFGFTLMENTDAEELLGGCK